MEKFKKLNRAEMKTISGGLPHCSATDYALCTNNGCVPNTDPPQDTVAGICGSYGDTFASATCWADDACTIPDN